MKDIITDREYFRTWTLIRNISHLISKSRDRELSRYGITVVQSAILYMINVMGERATPGNIARAMYREPTTISNSLIRMEKQGLVRRYSDAMRKSQVKVEMTRKGEQAYLHSMEREAINRVMSQLPPEKFQPLIESLNLLRQAVMQELGISPNPRPLSSSSGLLPQPPGEDKEL
jgi:DNA-binding MarR family transcriptional regulator